MPTTYNGIGTHYYGKKNILKRTAVCRHCGRQVELTSYDTRLWFVVLFIPIIPVGRKRIIDYCPACTRHYAVEADKWETAKQLEVSGAQEKFRASQLPEDAIALHQQLLNFHQFDEAEKLRGTMREKFYDNAKVNAYLGAALQHFGRHDEAAGYFRRALELRPDLPDARIGVARARLRAGELNDARKLLDFLEKPGAGQLYSLEPIDTLARAFQHANRHDEALDLFAVIQREVPKVAEEKWFRTLVARSEKSAQRRESQLPKLKFSWKRLFARQRPAAGQPRLTWRSVAVLGVVLGLVALGFVISNEYIRRHRTLHIVNDYKQPATVRIVGGPDLAGVRGVQEMALPEGKYHAVISGPVSQEIDFTIQADYFSRWFDDPAWVLNVGGKAILLQTVAVYSREQRPPTITVHYGKTFESFAQVTHPFRDLPESIQMHENESRTLVELQVHHGGALGIFGYYVGNRNVRAALDFSEHWLQNNPDDDSMLHLYAATAVQTHATNQLIKFLQTGLLVRPVRIEWHRIYQGIQDNPAAHAGLVAEYQRLLQADPTNSALLYLCGRLEPDRTRAREYFDRAKEADPRNAYPVFALGYDHMAAGDWETARPMLGRAVELRPSDQAFEQWLMLARFALGEAPAVEQEMRQAIGKNAADLGTTTTLIDALVLEGKGEDAKAVCSAFRRQAAAKFGAQANAVATELECRLYYELGDFAQVEKLGARVASEGRGYRCQALVEQGRLPEALKLAPKSTNDEELPMFDLALALAYRLQGDAAAAEHWVEQARQVFAQGNEDEVRGGELLDPQRQSVSLAEAQNMALPPQIKAALLANLAQMHPQNRAELGGLARRLNVERTFPYHLIQRATELQP